MVHVPATSLDDALNRLDERIASRSITRRSSVPRPICTSRPRREGDEYVCTCGKRWDVSEDRPCNP